MPLPFEFSGCRRQSAGTKGIFGWDWPSWQLLKLREGVGDLVPRRFGANKDMAQRAVHGIIIEHTERQAQDPRCSVELGDQVRPADGTEPSVLTG